MIFIYDERGERIRVLPADFPDGLIPSEFRVSRFQPASAGLGGEVEIFVNQTQVAVWDVRDDEGERVRPGIYHIVLEYQLPDGGTQVYAQNVLVLYPKSLDGLVLRISPNVVSSKGIVQFQLEQQGALLALDLPIRIYTVSGELIKSAAMNAGRYTWNLSQEAFPPASGVYLVVVSVPVDNGFHQTLIRKLIIR